MVLVLLPFNFALIFRCGEWSRCRDPTKAITYAIYKSRMLLSTMQFHKGISLISNLNVDGQV